jgi:hypothetical protein
LPKKSVEINVAKSTHEHEHKHKHVNMKMNLHMNVNMNVNMDTDTDTPLVHVMFVTVPESMSMLMPKVGEVPSFRASDTDTDLVIVSADLFHGFKYLKNSSSLQNEDL